jgi:ABC-type multidrug transport system ATPase subunit
MIAHRLTSVQRADRILVFDKGRIVEEGRHEELMRGGGIYEQMIKAQCLGWYITKLDNHRMSVHLAGSIERK